MKRFLLPVSMLLFLSSCCCNSNKKSCELTRFFEDGRAKPLIAIPSLVDATSCDLSWNLSEELTSLVVKKVSDGGSICVLSGDDLTFTENPFTSDLTWMKREFADQEFVAFLELVEHEIAPVNSNAEVPFETAMNLKMSVRLRVIDLRGLAPRIVLQEMVRDSYYIPRTQIPVDYKTVVWGSDEYKSTPMAVAHMQLVQEISSRIKEYLYLAKSR